MAGKSLQIKKEYQEKAKNAAIDLGLNQKAIATRLGCSRQPVSRFFNCKPVSNQLFVEICQILNLDWQEVTGLRKEEDRENGDVVNELSGNSNDLGDVNREAKINNGNYNETIQGNYINVAGDYIQNTQAGDRVSISKPTLRARNIYSFSHLAFQEYFTDREIILVRQSSDEELQGLVSHLFDKDWREKFLSAASIPLNAERLVLMMKEKCDKLLAEDKELQSYLQWLKRKTETANLELSVRDKKIIQEIYCFYAERNTTLLRIFYLGLDLRFNLNRQLNLNRNLYFYRDLDLNLDLKLKLDLNRNLDIHLYLKRELYRDLDLNLNRNLKLAEEADSRLYVVLLNKIHKLPAERSPSNQGFIAWWQENGEAWLNDFRQTIIDHRDIGHDWQFSNEQKVLLEQYYFANQLLTQCLHHDCFVSPEVRQEIEDTLLLPYAEIAKHRSNIV